mgnify:CR=1 FL=1
MTVLTKQELLDLLKANPPLVEEIYNPSIQVQPNGIELTVRRIERFVHRGAIAYINEEREISPTTPIDLDIDIWTYLEQGAYKVVFNEFVNIPNWLIAIARPRSSLLRSGVTVETGVWDARYGGRSEAMLVVHNKHGFKIKKNARIVQLVFMRLVRPVEEGYNGIYQGENL